MSEMPKFTPGPWRAELPETGFRFSKTGDWLVTGANGLIVAMAIHDLPPEAEPNAHLIAAAPELYKACQIALDYWCADHPNDTVQGFEARAKIEAALAKAEGRS
jgi:hypothetical protein